MKILLSIMIALVTMLSLSCSSSKKLIQKSPGQHLQILEKEIVKTVKANYLVYLPDDYADSKEDFPLILFLHGAGERGDDIRLVELQGPRKLVAKEGKSFPFVIVCPQCPEGNWWSSGPQLDVLTTLLDDITENYHIDKDRVYLTGLSMGGYGTWSLAWAYPERFAAIAPICGGGNRWDARRIAQLPVWVFHGAKDQVVSIEKFEIMVNAIKEAGGNVEFTIYPEAGHDSWTETYNNPELYEWFLKHTRQSRFATSRRIRLSL
jgi:predicted peptidase